MAIGLIKIWHIREKLKLKNDEYDFCRSNNKFYIIVILLVLVVVFIVGPWPKVFDGTYKSMPFKNVLKNLNFKNFK